MTVAEDSSTTAIDVLANDSTADIGEVLTILDATQGSAGGSVAIVNGASIDYTPAADFHGIETFTYTVDDGSGGQDMATVTVTVTPVADVPLAVDDTASTTADVAVTIDVLANDTDVDGDSLSVLSVTQGQQGSVVIEADQTVTYTPAAGFLGGDSFSYTIDDGNGGQDTAMVQVTIALPGTINFDNYSLGHYGDDSDLDGTVVVEDGGATLHITGNRWPMITFLYTVTASSVLEFDFKSTIRGEIHGLALDTDTSFSENWAFKLDGTQTWGDTTFNDYAASAGQWKHYVIPVGQFFTGSFNYLFFVNDDDANQAADGFFSNLRVYEEDAGIQMANLGMLSGQETQILSPATANKSEPQANSRVEDALFARLGAAQSRPTSPVIPNLDELFEDWGEKWTDVKADLDQLGSVRRAADRSEAPSDGRLEDVLELG